MLQLALAPVMRTTRNLGKILTLPVKMRRYEPRVKIFIERGPYVIRTVENAIEFAAVLRLRYQVFEMEFRGNPFPIGWDTDEYDFLGDHLIIVDRRNERIVGNYRIISSTYSNRFYSDSEFEIGSFLDLPGAKLELGRACIQQDYRNGAVMSLLWRGILEYLRKVDARYLFGCTSVKTESAADVIRLMNYFRSADRILGDSRIRPLPAYSMKGLQENHTLVLGEEEKRRLIPPLLSSYFRAGANLAVPPAYDRYFRCVDFFTVLDKAKMARTFERKFGGP